MNRTFLIILMIGTAMMIAVIGNHEPTTQLDTMPWEVDRLENGSLRVFGLTLGKTSIQEANQIFAQFGKTQLRVTTDINDYQTLQLITTYDELLIGGLVARITLVCQMNSNELQKIYHTLDLNNLNQNNSPEIDKSIRHYPVSSKVEMSYLNKSVSAITYTPSVDYGQETIQQNFGLANEEKKINEETQLWIYPEMGLQIFIHNNKLDQFVYAQLK